MSSAVAAYNPAFKYYSSGVLNDPACGSNVDHAILIVGYGRDSKTNQEFWLVRNSWDTTWGEKGYVRLAITGDGPGMCGIHSQPVWPIVKTDDGKQS